MTRTGITGGGLCAVLHLLGLVLGPKWAQWLTVGTHVQIMLSVVGELGGAIVGREVVPVRQGDVGADVCVFNRFDILDGPIGGIARLNRKTRLYKST